MAVSLWRLDVVKVRFSARTYNPISIMIRWLTKCRFSHVCLILPNGKTIGSDMLGGVKIREERGKDQIISYRYVDAPDNVYQIAISKVGIKYDFNYMLGWLLRRNLEDKNKLNCNEFIYNCFLEAGVKLLNIDGLNRLTPRDLLISPLMVKENKR